METPGQLTEGICTFLDIRPEHPTTGSARLRQYGQVKTDRIREVPADANRRDHQRLCLL